jgi:hypothetical protein
MSSNGICLRFYICSHVSYEREKSGVGSTPCPIRLPVPLASPRRASKRMWVCSFSPPTTFSFPLSHTMHHAQPQFTSHSLVTHHLHSLRCSIRRLLASLGIQSPTASSIVRGLSLAFTQRLTCLCCSTTSEASLSLPRCISSRLQLFVGLLCGSTGLQFRTSKSSTNGTKNHRVLLREPHPPGFHSGGPLGVSRASFLPALERG